MDEFQPLKIPDEGFRILGLPWSTIAILLFIVFAYYKLMVEPENNTPDMTMIGIVDTHIAYPLKCMDFYNIHTSEIETVKFDNRDYARAEKYYIATCKDAEIRKNQ